MIERTTRHQMTFFTPPKHACGACPGGGGALTPCRPAKVIGCRHTLVRHTAILRTVTVFVAILLSARLDFVPDATSSHAHLVLGHGHGQLVVGSCLDNVSLLSGIQNGDSLPVRAAGRCQEDLIPTQTARRLLVLGPRLWMEASSRTKVDLRPFTRGGPLSTKGPFLRPDTEQPVRVLTSLFFFLVCVFYFSSIRSAADNSGRHTSPVCFVAQRDRETIFAEERSRHAVLWISKVSIF